MHKVSADTITELSYHHRFPSKDEPVNAPTAAELIAKIEKELKDKIRKLEHRAESKTEYGGDPNAFAIALRRAKDNLRTFTSLVDNMPEGFALAPVYYSKIDTQQASKVENEYNGRVRLHFLKYIANNHSDELRALGISAKGVDRMRDGLQPTDENGKLYHVSIDHIIERGGSGLMGQQKEVDPLLPAGSSETYIVNHINNFILLPEKIHHLKNAINAMQGAASTPKREGKWILMLVPKRIPDWSGLVALPQKETHPLHGLDTHSYTLHDRFLDISYTADRVNDALYFLEQNKSLAPLISDAKKTAERQFTTVMNLAQEERQTGYDRDHASLTYTFNATIRRDREAQRYISSTLRESFDAALLQIELAIQDAETYGVAKENYRELDKFLRDSNSLRQMRLRIASLPIEEAVEMQASLRDIDRRIKDRFNPAATPPANDNPPPKARPTRSQSKLVQKDRMRGQRGIHRPHRNKHHK